MIYGQEKFKEIARSARRSRQRTRGQDRRESLRRERSRTRSAMAGARRGLSGNLVELYEEMDCTIESRSHKERYDWSSSAWRRRYEYRTHHLSRWAEKRTDGMDLDEALAWVSSALPKAEYGVAAALHCRSVIIWSRGPRHPMWRAVQLKAAQARRDQLASDLIAILKAGGHGIFNKEMKALTGGEIWNGVRFVHLPAETLKGVHDIEDFIQRAGHMGVTLDAVRAARARMAIVTTGGPQLH